MPSADVKILVPTKRVPSTDERIRIQPDGSGIEDAALVHIINPFDAIALEEALHIRECRGSEVEVTAVGIEGARTRKSSSASARIERRCDNARRAV